MTSFQNNMGVYVIELQTGKYYVGKSNNIEQRINNHKLKDKCATFVKNNGGFKKQLQPLTPQNSDYSAWERDETLVRMIKHGFNNVRGWEYTDSNDLISHDYYAIKKTILGNTDRCRECGNLGHFANYCDGQKTEWLSNLDQLIGKLESKPKKPKPEKSSDVFNSLLDEQISKKCKPKSNEFKCKMCDRVCQSHNGLDKHYESYCPVLKTLKANNRTRCGKNNHTADNCYEMEDDWECSNCNHQFETQRGCQMHEKFHCKKKSKKSKQYTSYDNSCRRCGHDGHYANSCYAKYNINGCQI